MIGSTVFSDRDFKPLVTRYEGRSVTLANLHQLANAITQLYLDQGYLTSSAVLIDQQVSQGLIPIRAIELPLVNLNDRGENAQDQGIYFSVNWQ